MQKDHTAYLFAVSYELGRICSVDEITLENCTQESVNLLVERGLVNYSKLSGELNSVIQQQISKTLRKGKIKANDVDAVLIVTESFAELFENNPTIDDTEFRITRNKLSTALSNSGIYRKIFMCSTFGGSSNFLNAIFIAVPLVRTGQVKNLLLVCADQNPSGISRFMSDALAIAGDGVATCLISQTPSESSSILYEIEHVGITPYELSSKQNSLYKASLEMYRCTKSAAADCYEATNRQPHQFNWLILNNYNENTSSIFSRLLGFKLENTYTDNLSRTGHVPACDSLINLYDLNMSKRIKDGQSVLIYVNGPYSGGVISLVRRTSISP